jgi:hypothetical protein
MSSTIRKAAVVVADNTCACCGTRDDLNAKFCVTCGARLIAAPTPVDALDFFKRTEGTRVATMRAYTADVLAAEDSQMPR